MTEAITRYLGSTVDLRALYSLFHIDDQGQQKSALQDMLRAHPPTPVIYDSRRWSGAIKIRGQLRPLKSQHAWTQANRFQYLWNTGLQTACRESRACFLDYVRKNADKKQQRPSGQAEKKGLINIQHHHHGETVSLQVHATYIVCFRFTPDAIAACNESRLQWRVLLARLPF